MKRLTNGELLTPAMEITDQLVADQYLKLLIAYYKHTANVPYETAKRIAKDNLGYWAGYFDAEVSLRVNKLFDTEHPIFGK